MTAYVCYSKNVPVLKETQVVVVGAGPAGIAAAIASARHGAKTLLVERYGFLGGMATAGLVGPFMTSYDIEGKEPIIQGIFTELVDRMVALGAAIDPAAIKGFSAFGGYRSYGHEHVTPFDPEALKYVAQEMALEAGVQLKLHTFFVDSLMEGDERITGLITATKSGLEGLRARIIIDTTGDADVAASAGAPFEMGRSDDGRMQPASLFFRVGNVNDDAVQSYMDANPEDTCFQSLVAQARHKGDFDLPRERVCVYRLPRAGEWWANASRVLGVDSTDGEQLTQAEIEGHRQVMVLVNFMRQYLPGFESCYLVDTATQIGVRESRRVLGEYVLTAEDVYRARRFDDAIARVSFPIDIHDVKGGGHFFQGPEDGPYYTIPYRCLVPKRVENLLVAGRPISATHEAHASLRVMPPCFAMGQAAGTAAALALETNVSPRNIDVKLLRDSLKHQGALV